MSQRKFDVMVISAFGRGHWPAVELAGAGFKVAMINVSESIGRWTPEDWEGPFGLFHESTWSSSKLARLTEEDYMDSIPQGLTVWLPEGPYETQGPMSYQWFGPGHEDEWQKNWLSSWYGWDASERSRQVREVKKKPFDQAWWLYLSHQLASTVFLPNAEALNHGRPLSIFSPFFIRRVSRRGFQQSLDWCVKHGVQVFPSTKIADVQLEGKQLVGVEISGTVSGALSADKYLWCMTSLETDKISDKASAKLFPDGPLKPEWSWVRSRWSWHLNDYESALPQHFVFLADLGLPWAHEYLIIAQKTVQENVWDFWVRIPDHQRFQRGYSHVLLDRMEQQIKARAPHIELKLIERNQEDLYDYQELGPSRYPVFDAMKLREFHGAKLSNVEFSSPEQWPGLNWSSRMEADQNIVNEWIEWRRIQNEKLQKKGGPVDKTLHPS